MPPRRATKSACDKLFRTSGAITRPRFGTDAARSNAGRYTRDPSPRDLHAPANPDTLMPLDVIEKTGERGEARGSPGQPAMQPDREHLRRFLALRVERVEGVAQVREELLAAVEALGSG